MNSSAAPASSIGGSINAKSLDDVQTLQTGLNLARASQLTMLRLQLALHGSNRRVAMQAIDNLLDIDAEMEGLAATLSNGRPHLTAGADFIGLQKAAIAAEKHALMGGDLRSDGASALGVQAGDTDLPEQSMLSDDELDNGHRAGNRRWLKGLAVAIAGIILGGGLAAYLWPAFTLAWIPF